jgi:hypothetical protein
MDESGLAMTSYLELDSAMRVQTAPDYGDGGARDRFFSGGLLWGIRPLRGPGSRRGGG